MDYALNIFDDEYFDDEAMEGTALKKAAVGLIPGLPGIKVPLIIGDIVHRTRINKSTVINKYDVMNVYGEKKGAEMYDKSIKFFISNGFLPKDCDTMANITYNMLTKEGKKFIHGYYAACDEIRQFDFNAAKVNAGSINKEATAQSVVTGIWIVSNIGVLLKSSGALQTAAKFAPTIVGSSVMGFVIPSLICTTFLVADAVKSYSASKKFNETMSKVKEDTNMYDNDYFDDEVTMEDAYDAGYYQALIDFGYDLDDDAMEDVDIFDEDFFDEAMEGNPENKKKRRAHDYMQAGLTAKEVEAMQSKGREIGEKYRYDSANHAREQLRNQDDKINRKLHAMRADRYRNSTDVINHGFDNEYDGWMYRKTHGKKNGGLHREHRLANAGNGRHLKYQYWSSSRHENAKNAAEAKNDMDRAVGIKKSDKQSFNDMSRAYHRYDGTLKPTPTYYKMLSKHMVEKKKLAKKQAQKAKGRQILDKVSSIANTRVPSPREIARGYRYIDPSTLPRTDGFWEISR